MKSNVTSYVNNRESAANPLLVNRHVCEVGRRFISSGFAGDSRYLYMILRCFSCFSEYFSSYLCNVGKNNRKINIRKVNVKYVDLGGMRL